MGDVRIDTHSFAAVHLDVAIGRIARRLGLVNSIVIITFALPVSCNGLFCVCSWRHLRKDFEGIQDWPVSCAPTAAQDACSISTPSSPHQGRTYHIIALALSLNLEESVKVILVKGLVDFRALARCASDHR